MKKTKLFALVPALVLSTTLLFSACNKDSGDGDNGVDPATFVSEQISSDKWYDALHGEYFTNGKVNYTETRTGDYSSMLDTSAQAEGSVTQKVTYYIDGKKQYADIEISATGDQALIDYVNANKEDGERYSYEAGYHTFALYTKDVTTDTWVRHVTNPYEEQELNTSGLFTADIERLTLCSNSSDWEYSEDKNGYVAVQGTSSYNVMGPTVLKFKDDKLAALYYEGTEYGFDVIKAYSITYGGQSVTLPDVNIPTSVLGSWYVARATDYDGKTYTVDGNTLLPDPNFLGAVTLTNNLVNLVVTGDGTAAYKLGEYYEGSGLWVWDDNTNTGTFYSSSLSTSGRRIQLSYDGTYLKIIEVNGWSFDLSKN